MRRDGHGNYEGASQDAYRQPAITVGDLEILATPTLADDATLHASVVPPPIPQNVVLRPSEVDALQKIHPLIRARLDEISKLKIATFEQVTKLQSALNTLRREDPSNSSAIVQASREMEARKDAYMAMVEEESHLRDAAEVLVDCAFMQEAQAQSGNRAAPMAPSGHPTLEQILADMRAKISDESRK